MDQNTVCNLGTYNRRVWCRAEVFSLYCRQGFEDMHIAVEPDASYQLINVDEDQFCDTFLVFERDCPRLGTFCCKRAGRAGLDALDALYFPEGRSVAFPLTRMTDRGTIFAAALPLFLRLVFPGLEQSPRTQNGRTTCPDLLILRYGYQQLCGVRHPEALYHTVSDISQDASE